MFIMFGIAIIFARLNCNEQADADVEKMWDNCIEFDRKWTDYFRYHTILRMICLPDKKGQRFVSAVYRLAHRVIRFN